MQRDAHRPGVLRNFSGRLPVVLDSVVITSVLIVDLSHGEML